MTQKRMHGMNDPNNSGKRTVEAPKALNDAKDPVRRAG